MKAGRPKTKCVFCLGKIPSKRIKQRKETCSTSCAHKMRWQKNHSRYVAAKEQTQPTFWQRVLSIFGRRC